MNSTFFRYVNVCGCAMQYARNNICNSSNYIYPGIHKTGNKNIVFLLFYLRKLLVFHSDDKCNEKKYRPETMASF